MGFSKPKISSKVKNFGQRLFSKFFGFDEGIDITNDIAVLYRKNVVIKNIIFVSNNVYTLIFLGLSLFRQANSDWLMTFLFFPITYAINKLLKRLINIDRNDETRQQVAMYVASFYMFLSSILVYLRLAVGAPLISDGTYIRLFEAASYVLIYYALVVISLYQNKRLLASSFLSLLGVVTIIHFTITYAVLNQGLSFGSFLAEFLPTSEFGDILLRTVVFMVFYLVVYAIVAIAQQLQEERKKELIKRRQVQSDFTHIVKDLFSVVFSSSYSLLNKKHANQVDLLANLLAGYFNLDLNAKKSLNEYSMIHLRFDEIKNLMVDQETYDEKSYDILKDQTELGSKIARRLQLAQKCEDIIRAHLEGTVNEDFVNKMIAIQPEIESQIILLADIYVTMRSVTPYKRPHTHANTTKIIQQELSVYFDYNLKEIFLRINDEFDRIYTNF